MESDLEIADKKRRDLYFQYVVAEENYQTIRREVLHMQTANGRECYG